MAFVASKKSMWYSISLQVFSSIYGGNVSITASIELQFIKEGYKG
jgi:hypothetical protein